MSLVGGEILLYLDPWRSMEVKPVYTVHVITRLDIWREIFYHTCKFIIYVCILYMYSINAEADLRFSFGGVNGFSK